MLLGNRLHKRLDQVLRGLDTENGEYPTLGLNPQSLLVGMRIWRTPVKFGSDYNMLPVKRTLDVHKTVGELQCDGSISSVFEFVSAHGWCPTQLGQDGSKNIVATIDLNVTTLSSRGIGRNA